jgi:recombinational DNA repair protein RecR
MNCLPEDIILNIISKMDKHFMMLAVTNTHFYDLIDKFMREEIMKNMNAYAIIKLINDYDKISKFKYHIDKLDTGVVICKYCNTICIDHVSKMCKECRNLYCLRRC